MPAPLVDRGKLGDRKRVARVARWQGFVYRVNRFLGLVHDILERVKRLVHYHTLLYTPLHYPNTPRRT